MFNCIMIEEAKFGLGSTLQNNLVSSINTSQDGRTMKYLMTAKSNSSSLHSELSSVTITLSRL